MADDISLLREYAGTRDPEAFAELVRRYAGLVYGVCLRVTGSPHDAEDVAQECFLELAEKAGTVTTSLPGWLQVLAASRSTSAIRRAAARRRHEERAMREKRDEGGSVWAEVSPRVDRALAELPEDLRVPLTLHYLVGRTQSDVADELGVNHTTISRRLTRGVDALREKLGKAGVIVPAAILAALLAENASAAAVPAALAAALGKMAIAGVGKAGGAAAAGAAGKAAAVGLGAMKVKVIAASVAAAVVAIGGIVAYRELAGEEPTVEPAALQGAAVAWGEAVNGLQIGISRRDGPGPVAFDGWARLGLHVRNVGQEPFRFPRARALHGNLEVTVDGKAPTPRAAGTRGLVPVEQYADLAPGQADSADTRFYPDAAGLNRGEKGIVVFVLDSRHISTAMDPVTKKPRKMEGVWQGKARSGAVEIGIAGKGKSVPAVDGGKAVKGLSLALSADRAETRMRPDGKNAEPVGLRFTFTNVGQKPIKLNGYAPEWLGGLRLEVTGPDAGSVRVRERTTPIPLEPPSSSAFPSLQPKKDWAYSSVHTRKFPGRFGRWTYEILRPGRYRVRAWYRFSTVGKDFPPVFNGCWEGTLTSNEIVLDVRPARPVAWGKAVNGLRLGVSAEYVPRKKGGPPPRLELAYVFENVTDRLVVVHTYCLYHYLRICEILPADKLKVSQYDPKPAGMPPPKASDLKRIAPGKSVTVKSWRWAETVEVPWGRITDGSIVDGRKYTTYRFTESGSYTLRFVHRPPAYGLAGGSEVRERLSRFLKPGERLWSGTLYSGRAAVNVRLPDDGTASSGERKVRFSVSREGGISVHADNVAFGAVLQEICGTYTRVGHRPMSYQVSPETAAARVTIHRDGIRSLDDLIGILREGTRCNISLREDGNRLVIRGASAPAGEVAWGEAAEGLQAGLDVKGTRFEEGGPVEAEVRVRNVGGKALSLLDVGRVTSWRFVFAPVGGGKRYRAFWRVNRRLRQIGWPLAKGEQMLAVRPLIGGPDWDFVDADLDERSAFRTRGIKRLPPGRYRVTASYGLTEHILESGLDGCWPENVTSGAVEIEIVAKGASATARAKPGVPRSKGAVGVTLKAVDAAGKALEGERPRLTTDSARGLTFAFTLKNLTDREVDQGLSKSAFLVDGEHHPDWLGFRFTKGILGLLGGRRQKLPPGGEASFTFDPGGFGQGRHRIQLVLDEAESNVVEIDVAMGETQPLLSRLSVAARPTKTAFARGAPLAFEVTFKNVSKDSFRLFDVDRYRGRWWQYVIENVNSGERWRALPPAMPQGARERIATPLGPGEAHTVEAVLEGFRFVAARLAARRPWPPRFDASETTPELLPGRYRATIKVRVFARRSKRDPNWTGTFDTKPVEFEIAP